MLAIRARITIYFTLLGTAFFTVGPKRAQMAPQWSAERIADYQTPVNILSKYDNLVEKKIYAFCLSRAKKSHSRC